jgi:uroporphyrinogen decarboxylase
MFPVEVHAGSDPVAMRKRWGRQLLLVGGFDKFAFDSKQQITAELKRIAPLIEQGGFIPHVDHRVPANVSYENYQFYMREKLKLIGFTTTQIQNLEALA